MKINRNNYEIFVLDFLEGNLNSDEMNKFRAFLEKNPELKQVIYSGVDFKLLPGVIKFSGKTHLKKSPADLLKSIPDFYYTCISLIEQDLTIEESENFRKQLSEDSRKQEVFMEFRKTKLKPVNINYEDKNALKKPVGSQRIRNFWVPVAAASVLILFLLYRILINIQAPVEEIIISKADQPFQEKVLSPTEPNQNLSNAPSEKEVITVTKPEQPGIVVYNEKNIFSEKLVTDPNNNPARNVPISRSETIKMDYLISLKGYLTPPVRPDNRLKPPIIYIPEYLSQQDLNAFKSYTIEDFNVKLLKTITKEIKPPLLVSVANAGIVGANMLTGWNMRLNTTLDSDGQLSSIAFHSSELNFSTRLKNK